MPVYLDNAATSFPKPPGVCEAVCDFMQNIGCNAGRGAYRQALRADRLLYDTRRALARLFNIAAAGRIVFTANVTEALNLALKGWLRPGDHVITSSLEHNAVWRCLKRLEKERHISIGVVNCNQQGVLEPAAVRRLINSRTRLIVLTHASNVTGTLLPIAEISEIAAAAGVPLLLDAAQTAGVYPIDVQALPVAMLAFTGHKGLMGPQGTGGLYIRDDIELLPLKEGGTGGHSRAEEMPADLPDRFEAGTPNLPGIAGLKAAVEFLLRQGIVSVRQQEMSLWRRARQILCSLPGVTVYGPEDPEKCVGVLSFNIAGVAPEKAAHWLDMHYGIMLRSGLHCAPLAHRSIGTLETGTLRIGLGFFNTEADMDILADGLRELLLRKHQLA
ncbi:MAG: aminotransferase class V-fold PLP-dependent enzyme [Desulfurispora sp.]|uniref:aminotransferase class V-fold PLP-dependent enzyme n=1 Tax=Desulfurispora sp. TaxID=3014275 RepID=UPI00404B6425